MSITAAMMVPHPPIILPNIGKGEERKIEEIDQAYRQAARVLVESDPDTVVLVTPHIPMYSDYIQIVPGKGLQGNMGRFGDWQDQFSITFDQPLIQAISQQAAREGLRAGTLGGTLDELDHGSMVPLYYLKDLPEKTRFVLVGVGGLSNLDHARLGQVIAKAAQDLGRKIAIVGSGDLSHCQKADSHYGFKACGPEYDEQIMKIMSDQDFVSLILLPEKQAQEAMVCGHQPFCVMAGALDGLQARTSEPVHSAVFGVGYGVVSYDDLRPDENGSQVEKAKEEIEKRNELRKQNEDDFVRLARRSIEAAFAGEDLILDYDRLPEQMKEQAGVFVSLHRNGELRGCIGTTAPTQENMAHEIFSNAQQAAFHDPRFYPLEPEELDDLEISVDVLSAPERIASKDELDIRKYGVIVSRRGRRGLLLPDLEGIDSIDQQIAIAKRKAGIDPDDEVELQRFEVVRHH